MQRIINRLGLVALLLILSGCATFTEQFSGVERHLVNGRPAEALKTLEAKPGPQRDRVLYLLNKSMLQRINGDFEASNTSLEQAKKLIQKLSALSISETTTSLIVNDATSSYVGDPHEQVMLHMMKAINYLQLGERDSARVEILQMDIRLRELSARAGSKLAYSEDAFGRYLAGVIYEELGEESDAMISYRKAYESYRSQKKHFSVLVPNELKKGLLRMSLRMGLNNEHQKYRKEFDSIQFDTVAQTRKNGSVIFLFGNGLGPKKHEKNISLRDYKHGQLHRIALPYYRSRPAILGGVRLQSGDNKADGALVDDIDAIAKKTLDEQMPAITARALARAVAKSAMVREARRRDNNRNGNGILGLLVNIATVATERADTRSWLTLPSEMYMARLDLKPGTYDITVQFLGRRGGVVDSMVLTGIDIKAGKNRYEFYHWVSPQKRKRG